MWKKKTKSDYFKGRLQAMRNNLKCNRDADTEKGLVYTAREGEAGWIETVALTYICVCVCVWIYTPPCAKQIASGKLLDNTGSSAWCCVMTDKGDVGDVEGGSRRDICTHIADSHCYTAETNITL